MESFLWMMMAGMVTINTTLITRSWTKKLSTLLLGATKLALFLVPALFVNKKRREKKVTNVRNRLRGRQILKKWGWVTKIILFLNGLYLWSEDTTDTINCNLPHYNDIYTPRKNRHITLWTLSREFEDKKWPEKSLLVAGLELMTLRSTSRARVTHLSRIVPALSAPW